jgi:hypothetical protein
MVALEGPFTTDVLRVVPWIDPIVEALGHDARSPYVERFWLPVLGPSTVWLLRRVAARFDSEPEGFTLDLATTAAELGLAEKTARTGPFVRSLIRSVQFNAAQPFGEGLAVRRKLPYVPDRHIHRFPEALKAAHREWLAREDAVTADQARRRVYGLALTLLRLGEAPEEVAWQLHQWRFAPPLAAEAVAWAQSRHDAA